MRPSSEVRSYLRFLAFAMAISIGIGLIGYQPTVRLSGPEGLRAMLAGCATSLLAAVVGAIPLAFPGLGGETSRPGAVAAVLVSLGLRFGVAVVVGMGLALSGWFLPAPLLIWVATSYLALLVVETWYSVRRLSEKKP